MKTSVRKYNFTVATEIVVEGTQRIISCSNVCSRKIIQLDLNFSTMWKVLPIFFHSCPYKINTVQQLYNSDKLLVLVMTFLVRLEMDNSHRGFCWKMRFIYILMGLLILTTAEFRKPNNLLEFRNFCCSHQKLLFDLSS